jgi:hypothetical protein
MALQSSGQIKLSEIAAEFGGSAPHSLSEYHGEGNAPSSGEIQLAADFYGTSSGTEHANTTITVATGGVKSNQRGVDVGNYGSISSTAIANSSNEIDEVYLDSSIMRFHLKTSTSYTAWTYIEITNGSTVTRFNRADASLSQHGITGAKFHHWSSAASGSPNTTMSADTLMGANGSSTGFKIVET